MSANQPPKQASTKPAKEITKGLNVVFRLSSRKTILTGGKNKHPKNHQRLRLYAKVKTKTSPPTMMRIPIDSRM